MLVCCILTIPIVEIMQSLVWNVIWYQKLMNSQQMLLLNRLIIYRFVSRFTDVSEEVDEKNNIYATR